MINTLKNTIVLISFILCFTSCDKVFQPEGDSQPVEDKKNYRYYTDYFECKYYSRNGELVQTIVIDNEYDGHKILSSASTAKYETDGVVSTTYAKYEYSGLICKCLILSKVLYKDALIQESKESTIEYLDDTYRHIKRHEYIDVEDGVSYTSYVAENTYDGKCITQSKEQWYDYRDGEIVPSQTSITTYVTNGLHQVGERRYFDDNGNLTDIYSCEYTYLNEEYWDYTEALYRYSSGESRNVYNYDDSGRVIEARLYSDEKLDTHEISVYDGDNGTQSGFSGDLTIEGIARYIKVPY